MDITAAQHISAVLTSAQSPRIQAGYQNLLSTPGLLTDEEIRAIERRLRYSSMQDGAPKWQCYRLSNGRPVISHIVSISEPDDFGRRGRYFAHSLIFHASGWQYLDDAPFDLLQEGRFFSSIDQVLELDYLRTGNISPVKIECRVAWHAEALDLLGGWSGEQLDRLDILVRNSRQFVEKDQYVALIGDESQIRNVLKVAFYLAPPTSRKACSFDTDATGCEWHSDAAFWGRGFREYKDVGTTFVIDAARREVKLPDSSPLLTTGFARAQLSPTLRQDGVSLPGQRLKELMTRITSNRYEVYVSEQIYHSLSHDFNQTLTVMDREVLTPLGEMHRGLELLLAMKADDERKKLDVLSAMTLEEYQQRICELKNLAGFNAWRLFSPIHLTTWFDLFDGDYDMDDLVRAVFCVAKHGSKQDRQQIEYVHLHLQHEDRKELRLRLKASPRRLRKLQIALDKAINLTEAERSGGVARSKWHFFDRITSKFKRS